MNSTDDATYLQLIGDITFSSGGTVSLSDNANNFIVDNGVPATLDNVNNTIAGAGTIGDANLTLINELRLELSTPVMLIPR